MEHKLTFRFLPSGFSKAIEIKCATCGETTMLFAGRSRPQDYIPRTFEHRGQTYQIAEAAIADWAAYSGDPSTPEGKALRRCVVEWL